MVIDEIAYIGQCNLTILNELFTTTTTNSNERIKKKQEANKSEKELFVTINPNIPIIYSMMNTSSRRFTKLYGKI